MIAGPLLVLFTVAAVVAGGLFVASLPGRDSVGGIALASPSPRVTPRPTPTAAPTARPTPTATPVAKPTKAPKPTPAPTPTPKGRARAAIDLCDPVLGFACGLDAGRYEPSRFSPSIRFQLGNGWSASAWDVDLIALGRAEGALTFASGITSVFPKGDAVDPPRSARDVAQILMGTDGVLDRRLADQRVDKQDATVMELRPRGGDRVALFGTSKQTFYLEPNGWTRIFVVDANDGPIVIASEPVEGSTLRAALRAATPVVKSLSFR